VVRNYNVFVYSSVDFLHPLCRDVKPGNILLTADGRAKVSDMGLSRAEFFSSLHAFAGTFMYAAPEVLLGRPSNEKVLVTTSPTHVG
jgi:serine/threonine protein kinase